MRVMLLVRALDVGGAEQQLILLAAGLAARGHTVTVATFYSGALDAELAGTSVELINLGKRGRWDVAPFIARLVATVRRCRPDVLYTFLSGSNVLGGLLKPFFGSAKLVLGVRASDMNLTKYDWLSRVLYGFERRLCRRADLVISNSQAGLRHAAANGFPRELIAVVPNGIDTERFRPDPAKRRQTRAAWRIGPDAMLVGVLARLDPMKGHDIFLRAAAELAMRDARLRFACIGHGRDPFRRQLVALAESLGIAERVIWPGLSDPVAALNALDLLCSPSIFGEGFSNAVAEALACEVPCVVTDVGDSAHIVGDPARVFPPNDAEAMAQCIERALKDRGRLDSARERQRVIEEFSLQAMVHNTERLMGGLLADPKLE